IVQTNVLNRRHSPNAFTAHLAQPSRLKILRTSYRSPALPSIWFSYSWLIAPNSDCEESGLSVTMQRSETDLLIRLEDAVNVTAAEELKSLLLEGLVSGRDVHLDLERVEEIDVTVMQLLWA